MELNPTINRILDTIRREPATAKDLAIILGIPLGNVIAILISSKTAWRNPDGTWEAAR